ncbi:MAG: hypothetical protein AAB383_01315 [Patescibacteria group bacterium]
MEKKNIVSSFLVLGIIAAGAGGASVISRASADNAQDNVQIERPEMDRTVENIENGVIITLTTDDATELERLQQMTELPMHGPGRGSMDDVDQAFNVLDNGVQITLTSEDPEIVEKLQNLPEKGAFGPGHGGHGPKLPFLSEDVTRSVEEIENGVVITLTSDDEDVVEKLQSFQWEAKPMEE